MPQMALLAATVPPCHIGHLKHSKTTMGFLENRGFQKWFEVFNHAGKVLMVDHELHVIVGLEPAEERRIVILVPVVTFWFFFFSVLQKHSSHRCLNALGRNLKTLRHKWDPPWMLNSEPFSRTGNCKRIMIEGPLAKRWEPCTVLFRFESLHSQFARY